MNNLTKKIIAMIIGLSMVVMMAPGIAQALTVEELQVQINALMAQLATLQSQLAALQGTTPAVTGCTITSFDRNLKLGMTGDDVKCLQIILNSDSATQVAVTGAGSPGSETSYFGPLTKAAVIKFQEKYAADILTPIDLTAGTGFVGLKTIAKLNALLAVPSAVECETDADCPEGQVCEAGVCVAAPVVPVEEGLTVELAADTPAATVLLGNQVRAPLAKFTFTNGDEAEGKITELQIKRIGIASDSVLDGVYLLDEAGNRIGDEQVFKDKVATFKEAAGLLAIPAGETKTILVAGDVEASMSGFTVGVSLTEVKGTFTDLVATFPIVGNLMSIATDVGTTVTIGASSANDFPEQVGKKDVVMWEGTLNPTGEIQLKAIAFKGIGNIEPGDLQNYKLYIGGEQKGSAVGMSTAYLVKFDLSDAPVSLTPGAKTVKVTADIVKGTGREVKLAVSLDETIVMDVGYGVGVEVTSGGKLDYAKLTISGASVTLKVAADSPVSVATATDQLIGKYTLEVLGERVKFTEFTATSVNANLTNAVIYVDGSKVSEETTLNTSATNITVSPFYVEAGGKVTVELKANTTSYASSSIKLSLQAKGQSKTISSVESGTVEVILDVKPASFEAKFAGTPDPFLAVAGEETLVAQYKFTAKNAEATIKSVSFQLATGTADQADISALKVKFGEDVYTAAKEDADYKVKDLSVKVGAGKTLIGDVLLALRPVGSQTDGKEATVKLTEVKYLQVTATEATSTPNATSSKVLVYNDVPIVTALTTGQGPNLTVGANDNIKLYEWKIAADTNTINATGTQFTIKLEGPGATATTTLSNFKVLKDGVDLTGKVTISFAAGSDHAIALSAATTTITAASDYSDVFEADTAGITLKLVANVDGKEYGYVRARLLGDDEGVSVDNANFVWYDGITRATGYLVKGLPAVGTDTYLIKVVK